MHCKQKRCPCGHCTGGKATSVQIEQTAEVEMGFEKWTTGMPILDLLVFLRLNLNLERPICWILGENPWYEKATEVKARSISHPSPPLPRS